MSELTQQDVALGVGRLVLEVWRLSKAAEAAPVCGARQEIFGPEGEWIDGVRQVPARTVLCELPPGHLDAHEATEGRSRWIWSDTPPAGVSGAENGSHAAAEEVR